MLLANVTVQPPFGHRGTDRRKALETVAADSLRLITLAGHRGTDRRKALETLRPAIPVRLYSQVTGERTAERHWRQSKGGANFVDSALGHRGTDRRKALETGAGVPTACVTVGRVTGERTAERHWRPGVPTACVTVGRCHRGTDRRKALETLRHRGQVQVLGAGSPGNGPPKGIGDNTDHRAVARFLSVSHRGTDRRKALETQNAPPWLMPLPARSPGNGPPKGIGDLPIRHLLTRQRSIVTGERTAERHWRPLFAGLPKYRPSCSHRGTDRRKALETCERCHQRHGHPAHVTGERTAERHWRLKAQQLAFVRQVNRHRGTDRRKALETDTSDLREKSRPRFGHRGSPGNGPPKGIGDDFVRGSTLQQFFATRHRGTDRRKALETPPARRG